MVRIRLIGSLAHLAGSHEIEVRLSKEKPVGEFLRELIRGYDSLKDVIILVNGVRVPEDYLIRDDDEIKVFPVISGG